MTAKARVRTNGSGKPAAGGMPAVTVVVPVYNVAPYIGRCIESLRAQTLADLEFIFVDDCSTDGSMKAVEEWAAQDERVRALYNEENQGPGPSRNRGIEAARGEYLSFVDPDDWVGDDFYELLYGNAIASESDISKGVRVRIDIRTQSEKPEIGVNALIAQGIAQGKPLCLGFRYGHQAALYRRALFDNPVVRYGASRNGEDTTFLLIVCTNARSIALDGRAQYYYLCGREGAATSRYSAKRSFSELDALEERIDYILTQPYSSHWLDCLAVPFSGYPGRMFLARKSGGACQEDEALFVDRIVSQFFRIPNNQVLRTMIPELDVLVRYGVIIPSRKEDPNFDTRDRLESWVTFLQDQTNAEQPYINACCWAAADCVLDGLRGKRHGLSFVKKQLGRIGLASRVQITMAIPAAFVALVYRALCNRADAAIYSTWHNRPSSYVF